MLHPDSGLTDSAGIPWAGRTIAANLNSADEGSADEHLIHVLGEFEGGVVERGAVLEAFGSARVLIPLIAELGNSGVDDSSESVSLETGVKGLKVDKRQELSIPSVMSPDGRAAMLVFSSVSSMARWDPLARPIPNTGRTVALAAAAEGAELVVLDPGSPTEHVFRRPALWAIAQGESWTPPNERDEVQAALAAVVQGESQVLDMTLIDGDPQARLRGSELVIQLKLADGISPEALQALINRLAAQIGASTTLNEQVDSLTIRVQS